MSKRNTYEVIKAFQKLLKIYSTDKSASAAAAILYNIESEVDPKRIEELVRPHRVIEVTSTIITMKNRGMFNELGLEIALTQYKDAFDDLNDRLEQILKDIENPPQGRDLSLTTPEDLLLEVMAPIALLERDEDLKLPVLTDFGNVRSESNRKLHTRFHAAKRLSILEKRWRRWARLFARH